MRLVQACLCGGKTWSRRFIHREGAVYVPEKRERADFRAVKAEVVDSESIRSGNVLVQSTHPGPQPRPQGIST